MSRACTMPILEKLGECFGLHRLVIEDIMKHGTSGPRPRTSATILRCAQRCWSPGLEERRNRFRADKPHPGDRNFVLSFQEGIEGERVQPHPGTHPDGQRQDPEDGLRLSCLCSSSTPSWIILSSCSRSSARSGPCRGPADRQALGKARPR